MTVSIIIIVIIIINHLLAYPFTMVLHLKFQQKIDVPVYAGHEPTRQLGCHLNL